MDWYNGGMEHTTLHLLYSRFWHKFLYDIGVVHTKEPYAKRTSHGMILGQNPHYVGNVSTQEEKDALVPSTAIRRASGGEDVEVPRQRVNPDDVVKAYGADTMRLYIMFIGDFEKAVDLVRRRRQGLQALPRPRAGTSRRWRRRTRPSPRRTSPSSTRPSRRSRTISTTLKMNTAIAALMTMVNEFYANGLTQRRL